MCQLQRLARGPAHWRRPSRVWLSSSSEGTRGPVLASCADSGGRGACVCARVCEAFLWAAGWYEVDGVSRLLRSWFDFVCSRRANDRAETGRSERIAPRRGSAAGYRSSQRLYKSRGGSARAVVRLCPFKNSPLCGREGVGIVQGGSAGVLESKAGRGQRQRERGEKGRTAELASRLQLSGVARAQRELGARLGAEMDCDSEVKKEERENYQRFNPAFASSSGGR